jgi:hypothetical protein
LCHCIEMPDIVGDEHRNQRHKGRGHRDRINVSRAPFQGSMLQYRIGRDRRFRCGRHP